MKFVRKEPNPDCDSCFGRGIDPDDGFNCWDCVGRGCMDCREQIYGEHRCESCEKKHQEEQSKIILDPIIKKNNSW